MTTCHDLIIELVLLDRGIVMHYTSSMISRNIFVQRDHPSFHVSMFWESVSHQTWTKSQCRVIALSSITLQSVSFPFLQFTIMASM